MTVLAGVSKTEDLGLWADLGATYPVLWDVGDAVTGEYDVRDRPMFMVIDRDMTILMRRSNEQGQILSEELVEKLLAD